VLNFLVNLYQAHEWQSFVETLENDPGIDQNEFEIIKSNQPLRNYINEYIRATNCTISTKKINQLVKRQLVPTTPPSDQTFGLLDNIPAVCLCVIGVAAFSKNNSAAGWLLIAGSVLAVASLCLLRSTETSKVATEDDVKVDNKEAMFELLASSTPLEISFFSSYSKYFGFSLDDISDYVDGYLR
jgi:hypothetical protein